MAVRAQAGSVLWFDQEDQDRFFARLGRTLTVSFILHLALLTAITGLRLVPRGERPLAAVEVNLVSLPVPVRTSEQHKPAEPVKRADSKPAPAPPVKAEAPAPAAPAARSSVAKDILKDLQLPPEAPKFGELTSAQSVAPPQPQARQKVKVPDLPRVPDLAPEEAIKSPQRASVSEDLDRELEEELKKVKEFKPAAKLDAPKDAPVKPAPQQEAAVPQVKAPQTQLKTSGSSGTNPYWARVESIIKSHWEPPPIDVTGQTYSAVVKFRFYRNGTVKDVGIHQSSGNSYFDLAGQRAVQKPRQFPPFPSEMTEPYQDVEMVFRVGETAG